MFKLFTQMKSLITVLLIIIVLVGLPLTAHSQSGGDPEVFEFLSVQDMATYLQNESLVVNSQEMATLLAVIKSQLPEISDLTINDLKAVTIQRQVDENDPAGGDFVNVVLSCFSPLRPAEFVVVKAVGMTNSEFAQFTDLNGLLDTVGQNNKSINIMNLPNEWRAFENNLQTAFFILKEAI